MTTTTQSLPDRLRSEILRTVEVDVMHHDAAHEIERLTDVLIRNGFVQCDIPACNCGSWHARYGLRQRMDEIKDALSDAGHPVSNENGNLVLIALAGLIADRDTLRAELANERARGIHSCHDNCTRDGCVNQQLRAELAALRSQEPVAFMWQHDETGRTGFVAADFDSDHWREHNPRLRIISRCYRAPVPAAELSLTDEQILGAARYISETQAFMCGIDPGDMWKQHGDEFKTEARAILAASKGTP